MLNTSKVSSFGISAAQLSAISPEQVLIRGQMLLVRQLDEDTRAKTDELKLLNRVRKDFNERIQSIQENLLQSANTSRKDGKRYVTMTADQAGKFFGNLYDVQVDEKSKDVTEIPLNVPQGITELNVNGKTDNLTTANMSVFFNRLNGKSNEDIAKAFSAFAGDKHGFNLYYGHKDNKNSSGEPVLAVYTDTVEQFLDQMRGRLQNLDSKIEMVSQLVSELNQQRKSAIDSLYQMQRTLDQSKEQALRGL